MQSHVPGLTKNRFPSIFGGHLEFLHKMQNCIYCRNSVILSYLNEIFGPEGRPSRLLGLSKLFPTIFGSHLEFLHQINTHLSET